MAKNIAGRILIVPRGTYDANATYEMLDLVMYNNASWLAKKTATGIEPTNDEYWHKMADGVELVTNLTTEVEGKALDASMGKVLKELIDEVDANLEEVSATHDEDIEALRLAIEEFSNIDSATIRYNEETDQVEVLFGGEWVAWENAHMKWDGHIFYNGNIFEDITDGYRLLNSDLNHHKLSIGAELVFERTSGYGSGTFGEATVYTTNKIDVTEFTKMRVIGTVYSSQTNNQGYVCTVGLSSIQGKANVCSFDVKATGDNNSGVAFDEIIDISSCNSEYYFTLYNTNMALGGVKISSIQFYN